MSHLLNNDYIPQRAIVIRPFLLTKRTPINIVKVPKVIFLVRLGPLIILVVLLDITLRVTSD